VELRQGVSAGDRVILNLSSRIVEGDRVTPIDLDHPENGVARRVPPAPASAKR
jgi:hypothetical protein